MLDLLAVVLLLTRFGMTASRYGLVEAVFEQAVLVLMYVRMVYHSHAYRDIQREQEILVRKLKSLQAKQRREK